MIISIGCDHIVTDIKIQLSDYLKGKGHQVIDNGTFDFTRTHYPIYGVKTAEKIIKKEADLGVVLCGTGVGITSSANKVPGIRAALVRDTTTARYAKEELNANMIGIGGKITGIHLIQSILDTFIESKYKETVENKIIINKIHQLTVENKDQTDFSSLFDEELQKWERGFYHD